MRQQESNLARAVLSASDWLKDYPEALVRQLVAEGRLVRLNAGEWAQAEGDDRSGLFIVIDGSLHSFCAAPGGRAVMIGVVGAGAVLGHATRYSGGPRLVTAVCVEPSLLLEVSEASLAQLPGLALLRQHRYDVDLRIPQTLPTGVAGRCAGHLEPQGEPLATWRQRFMTQQYVLVLANTGLRVGELPRFCWLGRWERQLRCWRSFTDRQYHQPWLLG